MDYKKLYDILYKEGYHENSLNIGSKLAEEIVKLYKSGNWWKENYDSSSIKFLIKGSYRFAVVINKNDDEAIGMGRILSDGVSDAYIQDLVVLEKYRGQGLGEQLVKFLVDFFHV